MKKCNKCKQIKNENEFHWSIKAKNLRQTICIKCTNRKPKPIPDGKYIKYYDYVVYDNGKVYSTKSDKYLKQREGSSPYLQVHLRIDGISKIILTHRLIGKLFVPNLFNKPQINHKDLNKHNNSAYNLEWVTRAENMEHARLNGRTSENINPKWRGKFGYDHNRSIEIHQYNKETGKFIQSFGSMSECSRKTGMSPSGIHYALRKSQHKRIKKNKYFYSTQKLPYFEIIQKQIL